MTTFRPQEHFLHLLINLEMNIGKFAKEYALVRYCCFFVPNFEHRCLVQLDPCYQRFHSRLIFPAKTQVFILGLIPFAAGTIHVQLPL